MGQWLGRVLLMLLGSAVAVALAEAMVRVADPHVRDHALPGGFFAIDAALGWRQRPNHSVAHRTRLFAVTYATNALGYRDVAHDDRKRPDRTRVLLFGDSQVFGWGIPQGLRFSDLLEARHPELEVWNHGVMGYGLDQQLLEYERRWDRGWDADAVVLFASTPTLRRMETGYIYRKHKPQFVLHPSGALQVVPPPSSATTWTTIAYRVLSPWYLPYFLDRRLEAAREILGRPARPGTPKTGQEPPVSALTSALLGRATAVARARGHQLLLLADVPGAALSSLRRVCAGHGIRVVAVEFPGDRTPFIFGPEDPHWNQRGHDRVAGLFWEQWKVSDDSAAQADASGRGNGDDED